MQTNSADLLRTAAMIVMALWILLKPADTSAAELADSDLIGTVIPAGYRYQARLTGVIDKSLLNLLRSASQAITLQNKPPPSLVALERRARNDIDRLQKVLRSEAYYDSGIDYQIDAEITPAQLSMKIDIGPRYRLRKYTITYSGAGSGDSSLPHEPVDIGARSGEPARAELVLSARRRLLEALADSGHPLAQVIKQAAVVDHADHSMSVSIEITPGDLARFAGNFRHHQCRGRLR